MNRSATSHILLIAYGAVVLLAGCFPEDSLDWSDDGSVGLLQTSGILSLVNGQTGELTTIQDKNVMAWPGISPDGNRIAYCSESTCDTWAEGWNSLPAGQRKMIDNDMQSLRGALLNDTSTVTDFNSLPDDLFGHDQSYNAWVVRTLCENADETLAKKLGDTLLSQGKAMKLDCCRLLLVSRTDLNHKTTLLTSVLPIYNLRFSPDGKYLAYLLFRDEKLEKPSLFVASLQQTMPAVYLASTVALGFDWRDDSQAIAYMQQEPDDDMLGVVFERQICDSNGVLLEETSADASGHPLEMHHGTGPTKQLIGTLFNAEAKVAYGTGERLFFSSIAARIPTGDLDEPQYTLFCYDFITGTVANVLPTGLPASVGPTVSFFSLSPDGRKVLLPMPKNRFAIYELGAKSPAVPVPEAEQFGEDVPDFLPSWKGNDAISCLVSENSHFLTADKEQAHSRKEVLVLNVKGDYQSTLSTDWPDDAIPGQ